MSFQLAGLLEGARWTSLSDAGKEKLKLSVIGNISLAIAGLEYVKLPPPDLSPGGTYRLLSTGRATSAADAAFFNAAVLHARNQDDFHPQGRLHLGVVALPVALAITERHSLSGEEFLDCLVAGYTAGIGLSRALADRVTRRGFRSTGVFGPFIAAATAARALRFDSDAVENTMRIATSMAGGLGQTLGDGSDEWQLHASASARAGIVAAQLSQGGFRGAPKAFDGKAGFFHAFLGEDVEHELTSEQFDPERALSEVVIKPYSVSGINQALMHLAERMLRRNPEAIGRASRITIYMNEADIRYPGTAVTSDLSSFSDAMMSAAYCCAVVFVHGRHKFREMLGAYESYQICMDRITLVPKADIKPFGCQIDVVLEDGTMLSDAILDPEEALQTDLQTVDSWAAPLWEEGGRSPDDYQSFKSTVESLEDMEAGRLWAQIAGGA